MKPEPSSTPYSAINPSTVASVKNAFSRALIFARSYVYSVSGYSFGTYSG